MSLDAEVNELTQAAIELFDAVQETKALATQAADQAVDQASLASQSAAQAAEYRNDIFDNWQDKLAIANANALLAEQKAAEALGYAGSAEQSALLAATGTTKVLGTVADLRSLEDMASYSLVATLGAVSAGDGGGGLWRWKSDSSANDNTATVVLPTGHSGSGRWLRVFDGLSISVRCFGATGNLSDDQTASVQAAILYGLANNVEIVFPAGVYRVTSGFEISVEYKRNLCLKGPGTPQLYNNIASDKAAVILLDSTDPSSYFMRVVGRNGALTVQNLAFGCAQLIKDRPFFWFGHNNGETWLNMGWDPLPNLTWLGRFIFSGCYFHQTGKSIYLDSAEDKVWNGLNKVAYFQNSIIENTEFHGCCSVVSETEALTGTLLVLNNVNHEAGVQECSTNKTVCDLRGIREITATNLLLEGGFPSAGWVPLRLGASQYDDGIVRGLLAVINTLHIEYPGIDAANGVVQSGGSVIISNGNFTNSTSKYKIINAGRLVAKGASFSGTGDSIENWFDLEDDQCGVVLEDCTSREFNASSPIIIHRATRRQSTLMRSAYVLSNTQAACVYQWRGGFIGLPISFGSASQYGSYYPSTDATYGRKLVFKPNASGVLGAYITLPVNTKAGNTVSVKMLTKLPEFNSGAWLPLAIVVNGETNYSYFYPNNSQQVVEIVGSARLVSDISSLQVHITSGTNNHALNGSEQEVYALEVYVGEDIPRSLSVRHPTNIVTYSSVAPTLGDWAQGDVVYNANPAAGGYAGWICVTAGTPGTWKAFGAIAP